MTQRKRFLFDADEVLLDFHNACFEILRKFNGRVLTAQDYLVWDFFVELTPEENAHVRGEVSKPGFCRHLKPLPGAQEAVTKIRELVDVFALTSPWDSPTWVYERGESLKEHFGFAKKHVVQTSAKYLVGGDFFLDDNPDHVTHWAEEHPNGVAMLWHIPNTRQLGLNQFRVRSWDEVLDKVRNHL